MKYELEDYKSLIISILNDYRRFINSGIGLF